LTGFEWSSDKAEANYRKHGVRFGEAVDVFSDDYALAMPDNESDAGEERFIALGMGNKARLLVVVYTYRGDNIRLISVRVAEPHERKQYEEQL
jgi:uncharacterized protein